MFQKNPTYIHFFLFTYCYRYRYITYCSNIRNQNDNSLRHSHLTAVYEKQIGGILHNIMFYSIGVKGGIITSIRFVLILQGMRCMLLTGYMFLELPLEIFFQTEKQMLT